ncbi:ATP-binding protein [Pararhizobium sp. YC-54]|uniref:ATP-binding protein n=1 Tax=Pararhizobium sp. YC-54 TaxID=2986920 RepID=UPI0021F7C93E|nr:ATP-binding protein [Pararhizobium sp. YC-54]MCW0002002.1 ATP-binding protein [Pararhizobium sp. YC-54]
MTRLLPSTLAGQLGTLLIAGILAAHLFSLAILSSESTDLLRASDRSQAVDRMSSLVKALDLVPKDRSSELVQSTSSRDHEFRITSQVTPNNNMNEAETQLAQELRMLLAPREADVSVNLLESRDSSRAFGVPRLFGRQVPAELHISIQLGDGSWLSSVSALQPSNRRLWRWLIPMAASGALVLIVVALVVHWITRPLSELADAAERIGRGEDVHHLSADGPVEVQATMTAFNSMRQRLTQFVRDRTQMLAAVGHDIRTPLTSLRLRVEMVDDDELRTAMVRTIDEMRQMIEATLSFARDDADVEEARSVDLVALLEATADDLAVTGQEIPVRGPDRLPVRCHPLRLKRAIANLLENALRYGGGAQIGVGLIEDTVVITIDDNGPGIVDSELAAVFEPFVRLDNSRSPETGGFGLGLATARSIVKSHGGDLTLLNRPGGGLRAQICLPA